MIPLWIGLGIAGAILLLILLYLWIVPNLTHDTIRTREVYLLPATDLWKLRICRYRKGRSQGEPVLFVHGADVNQHNFTTPAGHSMVDYLVERGYDCWTVDLRGSNSSIAPYGHRHHEATFDDYLFKDLPPLVQHIRRTTGYGKIHWVGHSMGGMLLYAYAQTFGDKHIASATTIAAPIGFGGTRLKFPRLLLAIMRHFPRLHGRIMRAYVPYGVLFRRESYLFPINLRNVHPEVSWRDLMSICDAPQPKVLDELIHCARTQTWCIDNGKVDVVAGLAKMKVPLLAIFAPKDPFVPIDRAQKFFDALSHDDKQMLVLSKSEGCAADYNHCEIPFARHARREVFEPIDRWIASHPISARIEDELEAEPGQAFAASLDERTRMEILSGDSFVHAHDTEASAAPARAKQEPPKEEAPPLLAQTVPKDSGAGPAMDETELPASHTEEVALSPAVRNALASAKMQLLAMESKAPAPDGESKAPGAGETTSSQPQANKKAGSPSAKSSSSTKSAASKKSTSPKKSSTPKKSTTKKNAASKKKTSTPKKSSAGKKSSAPKKKTSPAKSTTKKASSSSKKSKKK